MKRLLLKLLIPFACFLGRVVFGIAHSIKAPPKPERLGKVLVIKLWAIGEVVMALPVIEAFKRHDSSCKVHMLVGKSAFPVVEKSPHCDKVIQVDESIFLKPRPLALRRLAKELKRERYDTAIVLHHFFVFGVFAWLAGIPSRIGLDRNGEGFALTTRISRPKTKVHRVAEYLSTLTPFNANVEGLAPSITMDEQSIPIAQDMVRKMSGGRDTSKLIVLLPTGGANTAADEIASNIVTKRWPVDHYSALAKRFVEDGHPVLVLGGPGEKNLRPAFGEDQPGCKVLLGQTDLRTTMALIKQASLVVTNDSGPMHIAAALGVPVVAVFGPTDPAIVGPYSPKAVVLKGEEACTPCFRDDVFPNIVPACDHQRCMRSVTVDMVYKAAKELLSAHTPI
jgi:lipopolysaccharide heptosyltransferase II